jgi:diguanylate cyclase (GGDEF)-like protein/PAS domain S-box-containing protein
LLGALSFLLGAFSLLQTVRLRRLQQAAAQADRIIELSGIAWLSYDLVKRSYDASPSLCRLLGAAPEVPSDRAVRSMITHRAQEGLLVTFRQHLRDVNPYAIEFELDAPTGKARVLRATAQNRFDASGRLVAVNAAVTDVSEEYWRARRMEEEKRDAMEAARAARELANTDPLTGLPNRRAVMASLDRAIVAARRIGAPLAFIVFDIDRFKQVNDRYGHPAGDAALCRVARIAADCVRARDVVGRIGGEEFAWIVRDLEAERVGQAAERLREGIARMSGHAGDPAVTISAGFACLSDGDTSLTLFGRADEALYAAKRGGRNRIMMAA